MKTRRPLVTYFNKKAGIYDFLLHHGKDLAGAIAAHRALSSGLTYALRRIPSITKYTEPYYVNAARSGLNAAVTGQDILPKSRQALGTLGTSVTGLGDYEIAKGVGTTLKEMLEAKIGKPIKPYSGWTDFYNTAIQHPEIKAAIEAYQPVKNPDAISTLKSPLSKHLGKALTTPVVPDSPTWRAISQFGKGQDKQQNATRLSMLANGLFGGILHGLAGGNPLSGAFGALANVLPELAVLRLSTQGKIKPIMDFKKGLIGDRVASVIHQLDNTPKAKFKRFLYGLTDSSGFTNEISDLGYDLGNIAYKTPRQAGQIFKSHGLPYVDIQYKPNPITGTLEPYETSQQLRNKILKEVNYKFIRPARKTPLGKLFIEPPRALKGTLWGAPEQYKQIPDINTVSKKPMGWETFDTF